MRPLSLRCVMSFLKASSSFMPPLMSSLKAFAYAFSIVTSSSPFRRRALQGEQSPSRFREVHGLQSPLHALLRQRQYRLHALPLPLEDGSVLNLPRREQTIRSAALPALHRLSFLTPLHQRPQASLVPPQRLSLPVQQRSYAPQES